MTIRELYQEAMIRNYDSLILVIEWLVYEKGVDMDRDSRNVEHIFEKYGDGINPHVERWRGSVEVPGTAQVFSKFED
ncbi:hypothetical protein J2S74_001872 [Evansella vedderi]|uniref:Uncharacterized protein n=1 Tax=Evansella vedderi TaxID=38282 RepID=A0ABT9ZTD0_9BACI|nr:hypothetical protein [Evansella vedderi]MDQ0254493.1 hypothetical protein [Evansella vedderi]